MQSDSESEHRSRIKLETRKGDVECLVCSADAASDCQELARAFADHCVAGGAIHHGEALLRRVNRVEELVVCEHCQSTLSGEDKIRLMSLWIVVESLRNWLRTEMRVGLKGVLPAPPPIQLA